LPGAFDPALLFFDFLTGGAEVGKERKQQIGEVTVELIKALGRRRSDRVVLGRAVHQGKPAADLAELQRALTFSEATVSALVERLEELL
jgi:hypothetical protein